MQARVVRGLRFLHRVSSHRHHFLLLGKVKPSTLKHLEFGFMEATVELLLVWQLLYLPYLWNQQSSSNNFPVCLAVITVHLVWDLQRAPNLTFPVYKHLGNKISSPDNCI